MTTCVIYNPKVLNQDALRLVEVHAASRPHCELWPTSAAGDARSLAREAARQDYQRIVVAGGDGMLHEVVNGIAPKFSAIELGILPCGTGNDLARSLGLSPDRWDHCVQVAFGDQMRAIDLIRITSHETNYCLNVANGGIGGRAAADVNLEDKQRWGALAYWLTSVSQMVALQAYDVELWLDGELQRLQTYGIAMANGRFVGGGFPIAPRALLNDGLLDITCMPVVPGLELLTAGLDFALNWNPSNTSVRNFRAQSARLHSTPDMPFSIDGEPSHTFDATFDVLHRAIPMLVGDDPPGLSEAPSLGGLWS